MRARSAILLASLVATATAAACGTLVGIDDRFLDPELGAPDGAIDAEGDQQSPPPDAGPGVCPADKCTRCAGDVCEIDCPGTKCNFPVRCPAGVPCRVKCEGQKACDGRGNVDCREATSCTLVCTGGSDACDNFTMNAGGKPLCVVCASDSACGGDFACSVSTPCTKKCSGSSCAGKCACTVGTCPF